LAILTGFCLLVAGLLKLGTFLHCVPNALMSGSANAVAMLIILGQLGAFTGYTAAGRKKGIQTLTDR
jgi:SulP family sulfate permease